MHLREDVPLAPHTTFKIGGAARLFAEAYADDDVRDVLALAGDRALPIQILGGGSNTLFTDAGFDGVVMKIASRGIREEHAQGGGVLLVVEAGEPWDTLVSYAVERGLWGLENLSGIPGTVGASPVQNVGAYGVEAGDTIAWVEALDVRDGSITRFSHEACGFGYRMSMFKRNPGRFVVLRVAFALSAVAQPRVSYKDLQAVFGKGASPSVSEVRAAILAIRAGKFPDLSQEGTAGSFFLNPTLSSCEAERLGTLVPDLPCFPQEDGTVKISLAYLLDKGLCMKGFEVGNARLFEKQPLVVVARFGSSSSDVEMLMREVMRRVYDTYHINIAPEVCIVR